MLANFPLLQTRLTLERQRSVGEIHLSFAGPLIGCKVLTISIRLNTSWEQGLQPDRKTRTVGFLQLCPSYTEVCRIICKAHDIVEERAELEGVQVEER